MSLKVNEEVVEKYVKLVGDKILTFDLNKENNYTIYLKYEAHSIPYTIIMNPKPQCIQYDFAFPI